jgi:hypothetical protein
LDLIESRSRKGAAFSLPAEALAKAGFDLASPEGTTCQVKSLDLASRPFGDLASAQQKLVPQRIFMSFEKCYETRRYIFGAELSGKYKGYC